ncbi:MarR family winged helix-turn-helix transcriptional regulator [Indiicoccus explosivorum]|uniref:MarR family winged helix-turn-helix transcriptional regulator n=1 Tax=Indiicoccus explosivorum TaxID=1917864 RepID=UPI000B43ECB6|nr:MarR family winged helix-turn-helix transcriptional regulator [Indiicoccus explosivorum]
MHDLREEIQIMTRRLGFLNRNCCRTDEHDLSPIQSSILFEIERQHAPSMQQVAETLGTDITTFSRQVQALIKLGLVKKTPNPDDRRIQLLSLTTEGRQTAARIDAEMNAYLKDVFDKLSEEEQETVFRSIQLLNNAMLKSDRCCTPFPG